MVEWKNIGEVCKVHTGSQLNKADMLENGPYPVVNGGKEYSGYTDKYNENAYTITISQGGESAGYVNWLEVCFWAGAHCYVVENPEGYNTRYLYHTLKNKEREIQLSKQGAGIPGLNRDTLYKQVIPIPSLEEQTRIVGILDTFSSAIDNLKEQIAQRRKQYEYYRDQLLDLEGKEGVEMKTLGDVCIKTSNIRWKNTSDNEAFKYIDLSSVNRDTHTIDNVLEINKDNAPSRAQQIVYKGDVILGTTRPTLRRYCQIPQQYENQICSTGFCIYRANKDIVLNRWLFHNIGNRNFWDYCELKQQGAGYPCLSNSDAFAYIIPVPSLQEQQCIVSILDTFEASIQNLEAQLKERQKQYEYYRNKLLTFE